jgi:hypothetical protein
MLMRDPFQDGTPIGGFFDDIVSAAKGAFSSAASFVHHPPGWFAAAMPLFTTENQRYLAGKLGGSTGEQLYDAGVKAIAQKALGPQGPALVEMYNKVTEDAARGNLHARDILSHAPQIVKLATASRQGPEAFQAAIAATNSAVKVSGDAGADHQAIRSAALALATWLHNETGHRIVGFLAMPGQVSKPLAFHSLAGAQDWFRHVQEGPESYSYIAYWSWDDHGNPILCGESFGTSSSVPHSALQPPAIGGPWLDMVGGPWLDIADPAYAIGGPWLDIADPDPNWGYTVGGPWLDLVGAQVGDRSRRQEWPQTKALIQSAINEVNDMARWRPAGAYVWSLDPPSASPSSRITLEGITSVEAFATPAEALDYMRQRIQTPHVALAIFDRRSSHWPNPTNWTKSDDPAYEPVIAQQIERAAPTRMAGSYVGAVPWQTTIGGALNDVRARAGSIANKRAGSVVGVIHTTKDGLWHALAFSDTDAADDWLGLATHDPAAYTYAAYYDKADFMWPHPVNEKISGTRAFEQPRSSGAQMSSSRGQRLAPA